MIKKIWTYGTYRPVQRIGLIVILSGLILSLLYSVKINHWFSDGVKYYVYSLWNYPPEYRYDGVYAFYPYIIMLGVIMTWLYPTCLKIFIFIKNWIYKNK